MSIQQGLIQTLKEDQKPQNLLDKRTTMKLQIESSEIYAKLKEMIKSRELKFSNDITYQFIGDTIKLAGPAQQVLFSQQMIIKTGQQLKSQIINQPLELSQKEVSFYIKKIQHSKQEQYCKKFGCKIEVIEDKVSSRNLIAATLSYQGRELNVAYADISKFPCDAIVNSCNNLMTFGNVDSSSGVSNNIFDTAGPNYTKFCESYIQKYKTLEFGKAISYQITSLKGVQQYIINVSTPIYQNGEQTNSDYLKIEQNIKAIFVEANKLNVKTLAFPIFGGGTCGYSFKPIVQNVLNYTINALYSQENQIVQKVFITELAEQKLKQICQILKTIAEIPKLQAQQVKYQWQWYSGCEFYDYDDEDVNKQIDEGYEYYLNQKSPLELKLVFPFTKQPGTHFVDLNYMIMYDYERNINKQLSLQTNLGYDKFLLDNKEIDEALNEYLLIQLQNNNLIFEIFNKQHKIVFNNDTVVQINEESGNSRRINKIPYLKNQQQAPQNILVGRNVKFEQKIDDILMNQQALYKVFVKSFDPKVNNQLQTIIKQEIFQNTVDFRFTIPLMKQSDFEELKRIIIQNSIRSNIQIENGKTSTVQIFKEKQQTIQAQINQIIAHSNKYPQNWIPQDTNLIKVNVPSSSEEYKQIQSEFQKTDKGKILQIYRLQNLKLWEYYQFEVKKFLELSLKKNPPLTQLEQERYLWHGVRGQHPKVIYESTKEAFDSTFSNQGSWGYGVYFAEQASYSRSYSHKLTKQEDPIHVGKPVFLYCKVVTGKIHPSGGNSSITKPPNGYDCVASGGGIFILYGVDARRAYPAYEIIFE